MIIAKRVVNIIRAHRKPNQPKYAGANVLKELYKHKGDLATRLDAIELSEYIINLESTRWKDIATTAEKKKDVVASSQQILADRLVVLACATADKYSSRGNAVKETVHALHDTLSRVQTAIAMIETDHDLRALTTMLNLDNFGSTTFDIHTENREIKRLLHTADALLELSR